MELPGTAKINDDTIRYDIFKSDSSGSLLRMEAVEGFEQATNRIEELAGNDATCDYFLYSAQAGRVIRQIKRRSADSDGEQRRGPDRKTG
jgi:hypothetical protein